VTFDSVGNFLCADSKGHRILAFTADGDYKGDVSLFSILFFKHLGKKLDNTKFCFYEKLLNFATTVPVSAI